MKTMKADSARSGIIILALMIVQFLSVPATAQYDTIAISILDSVTIKISELETCSFRFVSEFDINNSEYGLITHSETGEVFLKAPGKMFVEKKGDKGHKVFASDGSSFTLYSYDKNWYAAMKSEMNLIEFIDSVSSQFGIEFPGVDVFYPDFTDNILMTSDNLIFLGLGVVNGNECYHVAGAGEGMTFQYWISADGNYIPVKLSIVYTSLEGDPRYSLEYYDWKGNSSIDDSKFEFKVPEGAQLIRLSEVKNNSEK